MRAFLWILSLVGAALGMATTFGSLITAKTDVSIGAGAALGLALAAIPYVAARAWSELRPRGSPATREMDA